MSRDGKELLNNPIRNRGTGFTEAERDALGLRGLLPPGVETLEQQVARVQDNLSRKPTPLESYIFLMALQDRNETLFYRTVLEDPDRMLPIIYTPTVGEAAQEYGAIFRRPRGLYVTRDDRGRVEEVLRNWGEADVRVIVVTDGSRILGLGDLGANGMSIPVGKLALYTAAGGVPPEATLPVLLDVGTDNEELRESPFYLGLRRSRATGDAYLELMDEFVEAVGRVFPMALIQFEDFRTELALELLDRYRERVCTFNDDIQGTAGVVVAGMQAAMRALGRRLSEQTVLFMGAGSANIGIGDLVAGAMVEDGLSDAEARGRCWFMDSKGLIVEGRERIKPHTQAFAHRGEQAPTLLDAVRLLEPTILVGATGHHGVFTEEAIRELNRRVERPVVFALSNPTSRSEATAEEIYTWTDGQALFASGSPFDPVTVNGVRHVPGQANNAYVFPGIGLGVTAFGITRVTDAMFLAAARAVAETLPQERLDTGALYPALTSIREVSVAIAVAVGEVAYRSGLARVERPGDLVEAARAAMYEPQYES